MIGAAREAAAATGGYTADQLAQAYGFGDLYANGTLGAGVAVALVELAPSNRDDIAAFQACYGTAAKVTDGTIDDGPTVQVPGDIEAELDVEGVVGMAPKPPWTCGTAPTPRRASSTFSPRSLPPTQTR